MGTWTRFYINSSDLEKVSQTLKDLSNINEELQGEIPTDFNGCFLLDETSDPTYLAFSKIQENWITVLYNSGSKIESWVKYISEELSCNVIVSIGQNTVDYYYFSQHLNGIKKREIEVCYGDDIYEINFGEPYDFENKKPGERQEYDGEISYLFDFYSLERYSQHFGLEIQLDWGNAIWTTLKSEQNHKTKKNYINKLPLVEKTLVAILVKTTFSNTS